MFDQAKCLHVETEASDHCMLVLDTKPVGRKWKRRFMFDRRWMMQEDIREVIGKAWGEEQQGSRLYKVKCKIKKMKEHKPCGYRIKLVGLKRKLADAYKREELFWSQKIRVKWLKEGDRNTSFFYASVVGRRKQNRISRLQKRSGEWRENEEESRKEIIDYFQDIYTLENPMDFAKILQGVPQTVTPKMNRKLTKPVTK
ncbi:uncharacterized protein [Coffea arabica]|uniref:Uncharacterized protein n=1 Tax=Coffea arabica TaxID=13443 RepID=A0ABM4W379_COFAR